MIEKYSVVFYPAPEIVGLVRQLKLELAAKIGWFNSKNTEAHITINEFSADAQQLAIAKEYLAEFAQQAHSREVAFDQTGTFPNGAFYLAPDRESEVYFKMLMWHFHQAFPLPVAFAGDNPHLTIARRLKTDRLAVACELFGQRAFNVRFICDRLTLRKFDPDVKQYSIDSHFSFQDQGMHFPDDLFS